jgi:hypothetical protein
MVSESEVFERTVAGRTIGASWAAAEAAGQLIAIGEEGRWSVPPPPSPSAWIKVIRDRKRPCRFQMVMFEHVYQRQRVPAGCEMCFKVKVVPRTLRQLMAVREAGERLPYTYKCGLDAPSAVTSGIYGAYFFLDGLPAAREAYGRVREAVNAHPHLGPDVPVFIKRGCTEFEVHCGPSDQYTFTDETRQIEAQLRPLVDDHRGEPESKVQLQQTLLYWIQTAYRLGDQTYLDFTGGRRLYPAVFQYAPEPPAAATEANT